MGRNIIAGLAGVLVALVVIMLIEWIGHAVYPPPPGLDMSDPAALAGIAVSIFAAFKVSGGKAATESAE